MTATKLFHCRIGEFSVEKWTSFTFPRFKYSIVSLWWFGEVCRGSAWMGSDIWTLKLRLYFCSKLYCCIVRFLRRFGKPSQVKLVYIYCIQVELLELCSFQRPPTKSLPRLQVAKRRKSSGPFFESLQSDVWVSSFFSTATCIYKHNLWIFNLQTLIF
jgi:hypothetical protein